MATSGSTALTATHTIPTDITYDKATSRFVGITPHDIDVWQQTWPCIDIHQLIRIAEVTVKHQPHLYPPTTIWRRMLCTRVFPHGKTIVGSIPLQVDNESTRIEKNPLATTLTGSDKGTGPLDGWPDNPILTQTNPSLSTVNKTLIGELMADTFSKLNDNALPMRKTDPELFDFLLDVAARTHRSPNTSTTGLKLGEALLLGSSDMGLTPKEYVKRKDKARKLGLLHFKGSKVGTMATWLDNRFLVLFTSEGKTKRTSDSAKMGQDKGQDKSLPPNAQRHILGKKGQDKGQTKDKIGTRCQYIEDEDEEIKKVPKKAADAVLRLSFGSWVKLSEAEHAALVAEIGAPKLAELIEIVNGYCDANNNKNRYVGWAAVIRNFKRRETPGATAPGKSAVDRRTKLPDGAPMPSPVDGRF